MYISHVLSLWYNDSNALPSTAVIVALMNQRVVVRAGKAHTVCWNE